VNPDIKPRLRVAVIGGRSRTEVSTVSIIPIDLQRRFEQRWAARFTLPVASIAPKKVVSKRAPPLGRPVRQKKPLPRLARSVQP
jgi:hypothetical protein